MDNIPDHLRRDLPETPQDGITRPRRGDGTTPRDEREVMQEINDAKRREKGELPHYGLLTDPAQVMDHIPVVGEERSGLKMLGKVYEMNSSAQRVKFDCRPGAADHLYFFHTDFLGAVMETKIDLIENFKSRLRAGTQVKVYRVMFDKPIFSSQWPGQDINASLMAMPKGVYSEVLKTYIIETGFTRRYTKAEQDEYKMHTGNDLLAQYWEVKCHADIDKNICGVPFDLYLPSGIDYEFLPTYDSMAGPIRLRKKSPDERVIRAATKVFRTGSDVGGEKINEY